MKIQNTKTKEKFEIISYNSILGLLFGGTYTISNIKTKEIMNISGNKFKKKYIVIEK